MVMPMKAPSLHPPLAPVMAPCVNLGWCKANFNTHGAERTPWESPGSGIEKKGQDLGSDREAAPHQDTKSLDIHHVTKSDGQGHGLWRDGSQSLLWEILSSPAAI